MKKCVIIGSGLGGLSCGCILAKNGYEVTVLEQGLQAGGCLQCFRRGDAVFDTGMHYIGSADRGQVLHTILNYLGVGDSIRLERLDPTGYDVISFCGEQYRLANGRENFVDSLARRFPENRDELLRYCDLIDQVAASSPMHTLNINADIETFAKYQTVSVGEVIDSVVSDPTLRQVLAGISPLYAGEKDVTPFYAHALIADFYNQSSFRIVGGSGTLTDAMVDVIRNNGGQVLTRRKAERIECNSTGATAVITSDGERFPADVVVSAIHPANTVGLVDSHLLRPAYRRRLEHARNTTSAFTLYLKFRKNRVKYLNHNIFYYRGDTVWDCQRSNDATWPKFMLYMHFCHRENPEFAETAEVLTYMDYCETEQWAGTRRGQRGESYEQFKRLKAERLIDALEQEIPGIRGDIEEYYTSTPLTWRDYTGVPEGAMYGMAKDVNLVGAGCISPRTNIPNLLLAGQCVTLHGMLGVLAGSLMTCSELLTADVLFSRLRNGI
ncbi:MAG: NAD(P)/FAD-dependent oxidoreductase [Prevotella sp.]|nr:NAD(P)/FAD-dependent oxidoreductase [Prevotella sp.]